MHYCRLFSLHHKSWYFSALYIKYLLNPVHFFYTQAVHLFPQKTGTVATVLESNIIATNGYINVIDKVCFYTIVY